MNITDVDDKTIRDSKIQFKELSKTPNFMLKSFTDKYTKYFLEDLKLMNIEKPKIMPNATDSIKEMEFLIQRLFEKNYAYIGEDGIYFDISKSKNYGQLVNLDLSKQKYNKENRLISDEYDKDNTADFALWKFKKEEDEPSWIIKIDNKDYEGRPGWHIECSAMSYKYLGKKFDIHTGGVDLKFPHHENEICQSCHALDVDNQANFWMHNEHLLVDGKKMSKSLGNFYTLRDIIQKGYEPLALRELYLRSNYRQQVNFTMESLEAGSNNIKKIEDFYFKFKSMKSDSKEKDNNILNIYSKYIEGFENAMKDDLNTPIAMSNLYEFMNEINRIKTYSLEDIKLIIEFIERVDRIFAIVKRESEIPKEIIDIAKRRKKARDDKIWDLSDKLRDELKEKGYEIKDSKDSKEGFILTKL